MSKVLLTPEERKERRRAAIRRYAKKNKQRIRAYQKNWKKKIKETDPEKHKQRLAASNKWRKDVGYDKEYIQRPGNLKRKLELEKERKKKKKAERDLLLSLMTPTQRNKFLAKERRIRAEKKRAAVIAKALKAQADRLNDLQSEIQYKRDQKQELEIRAHEVQREKLIIEVEKLNRIKVDRAVAKIISHRDSRAYRYRSSAKTCMQRVRAAIDDYYQLIANDNPLRKAA